MARSRWLCKSSTKNMLVKIVHPGGHVELHDQPVLAAEVMLRNPRCCVAYPHVFKQPWAIVAPDTTLMLGQKFYVVPISTVRKLQRLTLKTSLATSPSSSASLSPSPDHDSTTGLTPNNNEGRGHETASACWSFLNRGTYACLKQSDEETEGQSTGPVSGTRKRVEREDDGDECFSKDHCFASLLDGMRFRADPGSPREEPRSTGDSRGTSETRELAGRRRSGHGSRSGVRGSPRRRMSSENWQPSLHSISEE